jgi:hypothetical protein
MVYAIKNQTDTGLIFETFKYAKLIDSAYYYDRIGIMLIVETFKQVFRKYF